MKKVIFSAAALIFFSASAMANDIDEKKATIDVKKEETSNVETKEVVRENIDCLDRYFATLYDYSWMPGDSEVFLANTVYDTCKCCMGN